MRIVVVPDKFRGSATANEITEAVAAALEHEPGIPGPTAVIVVRQPMADGGEGMVEAMGGATRTTTVTGPLGDPVRARWRLSRKVAVIEMAAASGLDLAGGADGNDPLGASTFGTGELIAEAVDRGAEHVIIGVGGSATTDGGLGALRAMYPVARYRGVALTVATDVDTLFLDAAEVFGPQKGATPAQVKLLRGRLERLAQSYIDDYGVDVTEVRGGGAAGGLAGGLAAIGATLVSGFDCVADAVGLADVIETADLVVTGEGCFDATSMAGKVVGGVSSLAAEFGVPVLCVAGAIQLADASVVPAHMTLKSLSEIYGLDQSMRCAAALTAEVVLRHVADFQR